MLMNGLLLQSYFCAPQAREADEKARALKALASAERPELVQQTLQAAVGPDTAADDAPDLLLNVARRGGAQLDAAWAFFRECVSSPEHHNSKSNPSASSFV